MLYVAAAAVPGQPADAPHIAYEWLWLFRKDYGISLRLPNKRWKVPRDVFEQRLRIMWLNVIGLRFWTFLATGEEPEAIDNFDQKPFHVNESGSKLQRTLDAGALWDDAAGTLPPPEQVEGRAEFEGPDASRDVENAECSADANTLHHLVHNQEALQRYDRMSQDARDIGAIQILRVVDAARQAVMQRAHGKGREDALIAEAMLKIRDEEEAKRAALREHTRRRKREARAFEDAKAAAAAELEHVAE